MSKKIHSKSIPVPDPIKENEPDPKVDRPALKLKTRHTELALVSEQVAGCKFHNKNWCVPDADRLFPYETRLRYVDRHFPHAMGGELYVDEPKTEEQISICEKKGAILRQAGLRYCYITKDMKAEDVLIQMEKYGVSMDNRGY